MKYRREEVLTHLREIDEEKFEHLVADLWERQGWSTNVTQASKDRGIDIVAKKSSPFPQKHLIQAKRYGIKNNVGGPEIQQYSSLRHEEPDTDAVIIVTTSSFTKQARDSAENLNVKLVNASDLFNLLENNEAEDILDKYISIHSELESNEEQVKNKEQIKNEEQIQRLVESAKNGVWNPDDRSENSSGGREWSEKSIETNKSCNYCESGMVNWASNTRIGKCNSCGQEYKFRNGRWLSTNNDTEDRVLDINNDSEDTVLDVNNDSENDSEDTVLDVLAGLAIIFLLLSTIHSFISWSFHPYQLWLLLFIIISMFVNEVLIKD